MVNQDSGWSQKWGFCGFHRVFALNQALKKVQQFLRHTNKWCGQPGQLSDLKMGFYGFYRFFTLNQALGKIKQILGHTNMMIDVVNQDSCQIWHWGFCGFCRIFCTEPSPQKSLTILRQANQWWCGQPGHLLDLKMGVLPIPQCFCTELSLWKNQTIFGAHQHFFMSIDNHFLWFGKELHWGLFPSIFMLLVQTKPLIIFWKTQLLL